MQWSGWLLVIGMVLLWTTSPASPSNASPRELKVLRAALKKQQRLKEQQQQRSQSAGGNSKGASIGGSGEYVPDAGPWSASSTDGDSEPSCDQLRQMWRLSKRHSRAAEATNEIPQYADPFARAASVHYARQRQQGISGGAEPTLRPRQERRPVIYGRLHSSPSAADGQEVVDRPPRPFDVLRKLSWAESSTDGSSAGPTSDSTNGQTGRSGSAIVLYGEEDRSPFPKSPAKGSLQHLRELVREEQGGHAAVKGSFQQLRDIVREESRNDRQGRLSSSSRSDWTDADVGRVVTSPADHNINSKHSLFAMQGDAPYDSAPALPYQHSYPRRPSNNNNYSRLSSFGKSHHRNQNSHKVNRQQANDPLDPAIAAAVTAAVAASRKPFQLRDPPRPRISSSRLLGNQRAAAAAANNHRWTPSSSSADTEDDVGVVRGHVAARSGVKTLYSTSKPNRKSFTLAETEEDDVDCGDEVVDFCQSHSDCRCASVISSVQQRCQRGRCVPVSKNGGQKRQRNHQKRKPPTTSMHSRRLGDDERELNEDEWFEDDRDPSRLEQLLQEDQQSEDETTDLWLEKHRSRPNGSKADTIRDIIDALQQIDQQEPMD